MDRCTSILARPALMIACLVMCLFPMTLMAKSPLDEYVVKAAFIFNFAKYVTWPQESFSDSSSPLSICVISPDPFGTSLDELKHKSISGHPVDVKRVTPQSGEYDCHVVFSATENVHEMDELFASTNAKPILTIGDAVGFAQRGGMINFYKEGERIRFEINVSAIKKSGLEINARLLQVAKIVGSRKESNR